MTTRSTGRFAVMALIAAALAATTGCETQSTATPPGAPPPALQERTVALEPCQDRTGEAVDRDLAAEATTALRERLAQSAVFRFGDAAALSLRCDVEGFEPGSAFKRWLMPGWGATRARIKVSVWSVAERRIIATFQSSAQVSAGGLYTIGADEYILDVAAEDVVDRMEAWASGA